MIEGVEHLAEEWQTPARELAEAFSGLRPMWTYRVYPSAEDRMVARWDFLTPDLAFYLRRMSSRVWGLGAYCGCLGYEAAVHTFRACIWHDAGVARMKSRVTSTLRLSAQDQHALLAGQRPGSATQLVLRLWRQRVEEALDSAGVEPLLAHVEADCLVDMARMVMGEFGVPAYMRQAQ